jgi:ABC-2 type transport system permease protein
MKKHPIHKLRASNPYQGFIGVFLREWRRLRADGPLKILLFAIAPVCCWLFCALYGDGTIKDLPIGICDQDQSALSRTITRATDATKLMRVAQMVGTVQELKAGIRSGAFCAGFYFPQNMESDVKSGKQAQPIIFRNGVNYLVSSFVGRESQNLLRTINAGLVKQRLCKSGISQLRALALV